MYIYHISICKYISRHIPNLLHGCHGSLSTGAAYGTRTHPKSSKFTKFRWIERESWKSRSSQSSHEHASWSCWSLLFSALVWTVQELHTTVAQGLRASKIQRTSFRGGFCFKWSWWGFFSGIFCNNALARSAILWPWSATLSFNPFPSSWNTFFGLAGCVHRSCVGSKRKG